MIIDKKRRNIRVPPEYVRTVTMDMSCSYISAAAQYLQNADIVLDRFHIMT